MGALLKPIYPIQKRIQFIFDFFRWNPNWEFLSYEDVQQYKIHTYANYEEDPNLLTMKDLGLQPEDIVYWEAKLLGWYYDRFSFAAGQMQEQGHYKGFGRWVPNTHGRTHHGYAHYGFRGLRRGRYQSDWNSSDVVEQDWSVQPTEWKKDYGSDIDGKSRNYHPSDLTIHGPFGNNIMAT